MSEVGGIFIRSKDKEKGSPRMDREMVVEALEIVQAQLGELHEQRKSLAMGFAISLGVEDNNGINLDELSAWARKMKKVNTQLQDLADQRRELREAKRQLSPCVCDCH